MRHPPSLLGSRACGTTDAFRLVHPLGRDQPGGDAVSLRPVDNRTEESAKAPGRKGAKPLSLVYLALRLGAFALCSPLFHDHVLFAEEVTSRRPEDGKTSNDQ